MKVHALICLVLISALAAPIPGTYAQRERDKAVPGPAHGNADYITAGQLKDYLDFIASDELEGRGTPSRGPDITAKFIATHLSRWGLRPGGDEGSYFQRIALGRSKIDPLQTHAELNGQKFSYGDDFLANVFPGTLVGPIVYVGKGWVIIAVLEGSDPALKNEYVAISAHYDHLGIGTPVNGDAIYNGADDDGSGTAAVLALAEAFARGPRPKRTILFIWHCGEERFLWGSRYFTEHPTIPLNQIIADLNMDMIGRTRKEADANPANKMLVKPGEIYVIGSKKMSTELGEISEAVNQSYLHLTFNYQFDDPKDTSQLFSRSDHISYARKGIPIIFYYNGEHEDYHQPSDSVEKIDYQNMEKVARTVYATAWELANRAQRPLVDKPL